MSDGLSLYNRYCAHMVGAGLLPTPWDELREDSREAWEKLALHLLLHGVAKKEHYTGRQLRDKLVELCQGAGGFSLWQNLSALHRYQWSVFASECAAWGRGAAAGVAFQKDVANA